MNNNNRTREKVDFCMRFNLCYLDIQIFFCPTNQNQICLIFEDKKSENIINRLIDIFKEAYYKEFKIELKYLACTEKTLIDFNKQKRNIKIITFEEC